MSKPLSSPSEWVSGGIDSNRLFGVSPGAAPFLVLRGRPHSLKRRGIVLITARSPVTAGARGSAIFQSLSLGTRLDLSLTAARGHFEARRAAARLFIPVS